MFVLSARTIDGRNAHALTRRGFTPHRAISRIQITKARLSFARLLKRTPKSGVEESCGGAHAVVLPSNLSHDAAWANIVATYGIPKETLREATAPCSLGRRRTIEAPQDARFAGAGVLINELAGFGSGLGIYGARGGGDRYRYR